MPRPVDQVLLAQLKKSTCPGGAGHVGTRSLKAQCSLCVATAESSSQVLTPKAAEPAAPWTRTVPGPGDKKKK
jgi:hypothetical protein